MKRSTSTVTAGQPGAAVVRPHRWLLFVHQLPSSPSNLRVRTWRRLQQIGALPVKQALYVLPDTPSAREDFEWLKSEIESAGGQASVFIADGVDAWSNDMLVDEFRRTREAAYGALARDVEQLLRRRSRGTKRDVPGRVLQQISQRLTAVEQVDFFGSAGRDRVVTLMQQLENRATRRSGRSGITSAVPGEYRGRVWVTRPRPGVDRMASAWLIRTFIDREARFGFVTDRDAVPSDAVAFDMFGVEFTHRGEFCTFETLCDVFRLQDPALSSIAAIVHDLDLKDGKFRALEAPTVGVLIDGLRLAHEQDDVLLAQGIAVFESLYRGIAEAQRLQGPRQLAAKKRLDRARSSKRRRRNRR